MVQTVAKFTSINIDKKYATFYRIIVPFFLSYENLNLILPTVQKFSI